MLPRIEPSYFADKKIAGLSILTDEKTKPIQTLIVDTLKQQFSPLCWDFLQDIIRLNKEYTPADLEAVFEKYIKNNEINISMTLIENLLTNKTNNNLTLIDFQAAFNEVFTQFFVSNTLVTNSFLPSTIAEKLDKIKTNEALYQERDLLAVWKDTLVFINDKLNIIATEKKDSPDNKQLRKQETALRGSTSTEDITKLIAQITDKQALVDQYIEQKAAIETNLNTAKQGILAKAFSTEGTRTALASLDAKTLRSLVSRYSASLQIVQSEHEKSSNTAAVNRAEIAGKAITALETLQTEFLKKDPAPDSEGKIKLLLSFQQEIIRLKELNPRETSLDLFFKKFPGKNSAFALLNDPLNAMTDPTKHLGNILQLATTVSHDIESTSDAYHTALKALSNTKPSTESSSKKEEEETTSSDFKPH